MKIFAVILLSMFIAATAVGQTISVSGVVSDQKGQPVPFAFVRDVQHNYATYADSTGAFKLNADPASSLEVLANNYQGTTIKIDNKSTVKIVLTPGLDNGSVTSLKADQSNEPATFLRARQQMVIAHQVDKGAGGDDVTVVRSGFVLEPTRGSRYLFDDWVPGFGVGKDDGLIVETTNMFNYDKMNGNIMYTNDGKSIAGVSPANIKTFSLYDSRGHAHIFESEASVNGKPFVEVLVSTPKYKIYKKVTTRLSRADYHTDGVLEVGRRYDAYLDNVYYYFLKLSDGKPQQISLKKRTIKELFAGDADKFIESQGGRKVDEDYLRDLGYSLN